jgi:hypothetical protein
MRLVSIWRKPNVQNFDDDVMNVICIVAWMVIIRNIWTNMRSQHRLQMCEEEVNGSSKIVENIFF